MSINSTKSGQVQAIRVCFTSYNPQEPQFNSKKMNYLCYQQEAAPTTGNLHWQGYVEFIKKVSLSAVGSHLHDVKVPGYNPIHYEIARGTAEQNAKYCSKSDSSVPETWKTHGESKHLIGQGKRSDIENMTKMVKDGAQDADIIDAVPSAARMGNHIKFVREAYQQRQIKEQRTRDVAVYYLWGPPGCGKSTFANNYMPDRERCSVMMQNQNIWFQGYTNQPIIVFDDYNPANIPCRELLKICDVYSVSMSSKGSHVYALWDTVFITSNFPPPQEPAFLRRITEIVEMEPSPQFIHPTPPREPLNVPNARRH